MPENNQIEKKFSIGKIWEKIKSLFKFEGTRGVVFVKRSFVLLFLSLMAFYTYNSAYQTFLLFFGMVISISILYFISCLPFLNKIQFIKEMRSFFKFKGSETVVFVKKNIVIFLFSLVFLMIYSPRFSFYLNQNNYYIFICLSLYIFCFFFLGLLFNKTEYMKYSILFTYLYISLNVFPDTIEIFSELFLKKCCDLRDFITFPLYFLFSLIVWHKAEFFLFFFVCIPFISIFFVKFKPKEIIKNRGVKKFFFILLLLVYALIPDIYFLVSGRYEKEKCNEKKYAYCFDHQPTWYSTIVLLKKGAPPLD